MIDDKDTCTKCRGLRDLFGAALPPAALDVVLGEGGARVAGVCRRCWTRFEWLASQKAGIDGSWSEVRESPREKKPEPEKPSVPECKCENLDPVRDMERRVTAKVCRACHRVQRRAECIVCEKVMFLREDDRTRKPICGGACRKEHSAQLRRNLAEQKAKNG